MWGERNNPHAEEKMAQLLTAWRNSNRPIFHIQHLSQSPNSPLHPSHPGHEIKEALKPLSQELLFQKQVNSAFIGTDLEEKLREQGVDTLVIVGLTTPHCVSTTTRMAGNFGFKTYLVSDATAAFALAGHEGNIYSAQDIHDISLATLHGEFATVVETSAMLEAI